MSLDPSDGGASQRRVSRRTFLSTGAQLAAATGVAPFALEGTQAALAATRKRGAPGLVGMDHAGIMVPNIEEATDWFRDILGAKDPLTFGPFSDPTGNLMRELVGVNPRAVIPQIKQLRIGHSANIELLEYQAPHQNHTHPKNSDFGGHHIAFYVRDIDKAVKYMKSRGVEKLLGPFSVTAGPAAGQTINYFRTPFGLFIEFITYPHGEAYQHAGLRPLWSPKLNGLGSVQTKVPGLLGIDHIGFTVPNVTEAARWFENVLGFTNPLTWGPFSDPTGDLMRQLLDVNPRAVIEQVRMLRGGAGPNVELFQYSAPDQDHTFPLNSDYGGHHIAFYVRDIAKAVKYMESKHVKKLLGPFSITAGPADGQTINYFHPPFGTYVEFISYPHGMAYEKTAPVPLWNPRNNRPTRVQRGT
jgi:catechol 2,3-dioxygenase-like lactoylglutathione lyase family enzyme